MNRKRRPLGKPTDEVAVTRQEFEELRESVDRLHRGLARGMSIRPVVSTDPLVDDSYEIFFDGSVDRADTVETITDGAAPGSSPAPTVTGALGALVVSWTAIANADPVTYEVHLSDTTGFVPGATTLAAEIRGTLIFLRELPDGTPLDYFEPDGVTPKVYYVKLVARDGDGSAAASVEGSGSMDQTGEPDITAGSITAEKLAATLVLSSLFQTASSGQRVEFDADGLRLYASDGTTVLVNIPTDGSDPEFEGAIVAEGLDFLTDPANPLFTDGIRWLREVDDEFIAALVARRYITDDGSILQVTASEVLADTVPTEIRISAVQESGVTGAELSLATLTGDDSEISLVGRDAGGSSLTRMLLRGDGASDFLQLLTRAERKVAFGSTTITGDGDASADKTVAHGLGVVPVFAIAITGSASHVAAVNSLDSTNVVFRVRHADGANWSSVNDLYWLAIG